MNLINILDISKLKPRLLFFMHSYTLSFKFKIIFGVRQRNINLFILFPLMKFEIDASCRKILSFSNPKIITHHCSFFKKHPVKQIT